MLRVLEPFIMLALLLALGAYLYRSKLLDLDFCRRLSALVVRVTLPVMLFVSMYSSVDLESLRQGWIFTAMGLGTCIFLAITAHYSARLFGLQGMSYGTYQILCTNGNNVFLPIPIISFLFGAPYVIYAVLFELGAGFFYWTYGVSHFRSGPKFNLKRLFNGNMLGLSLGLAAGLLNVSIPNPIFGAMETIGNITLGTAMLIIGALIAHLVAKRPRLRREVWSVVLHRLLLSPLAGFAVLWNLQLSAEFRTIFLVMLSMPPLMTTALVAASYHADEELATMGVVVPTVLSFVMLPLVLLFV